MAYVLFHAQNSVRAGGAPEQKNLFKIRSRAIKMLITKSWSTQA